MLFTPWKVANLTAPNRLVRSATYEGMADEGGRPLEALGLLYRRLARAGVGTIITGFCYVSREGRAMQPCQCGIDTDDKTEAWASVVRAVRGNGETEAAQPLMIMQIAHAGRQTLPAVTGLPALAPTAKRSPYFRVRPRAMDHAQIKGVAAAFGRAARRAQAAGFDGVQLHAAHGYLIHQFLSPHLNDRVDCWGQDRLAFLRSIVTEVQRECGPRFPLFVKVSGADGHPGGLTPNLTAQYAREMEQMGIAALEVSYGTMDEALNIFRGSVPTERVLRHNPLIVKRPGWMKALWKRYSLPRLKKHLLAFSENYNLEAARSIRRVSSIPLLLVGGIRSREGIERILESGDADAVALCRPLICEPDLAERFRSGATQRSRCIACNACAVMCDSHKPLRCYLGG